MSTETSTPSYAPNAERVVTYSRNVLLDRVVAAGAEGKAEEEAEEDQRLVSVARR